MSTYKCMFLLQLLLLVLCGLKDRADANANAEALNGLLLPILIVVTTTSFTVRDTIVGAKPMIRYLRITIVQHRRQITNRSTTLGNAWYHKLDSVVSMQKCAASAVSTCGACVNVMDICMDLEEDMKIVTVSTEVAETTQRMHTQAQCNC